VRVVPEHDVQRAVRVRGDATRPGRTAGKILGTLERLERDRVDPFDPRDRVGTQGVAQEENLTGLAQNDHGRRDRITRSHLDVVGIERGPITGERTLPAARPAILARPARRPISGIAQLAHTADSMLETPAVLAEDPIAWQLVIVGDRQPSAALDAPTTRRKRSEPTTTSDCAPPRSLTTSISAAIPIRATRTVMDSAGSPSLTADSMSDENSRRNSPRSASTRTRDISMSTTRPARSGSSSSSAARSSSSRSTDVNDT